MHRVPTDLTARGQAGKARPRLVHAQPPSLAFLSRARGSPGAEGTPDVRGAPRGSDGAGTGSQGA